MSDESVPQRPAGGDRDAWRAFWTAQGMPWRTEPEVGEDRQRYLAERRGVEPDIRQGIYPFRDERGGIKLTRADVEWLLATHEQMGVVGPVNLNEERAQAAEAARLPIQQAVEAAKTLMERRRRGLDLRGVDCRSVDLSGCRWLAQASITPPSPLPSSADLNWRRHGSLRQTCARVAFAIRT